MSSHYIPLQGMAFVSPRVMPAATANDSDHTYGKGPGCPTRGSASKTVRRQCIAVFQPRPSSYNLTSFRFREQYAVLLASRISAPPTCNIASVQTRENVRAMAAMERVGHLGGYAKDCLISTPETRFAMVSDSLSGPKSLSDLERDDFRCAGPSVPAWPGSGGLLSDLVTA